MLRLLLGIALFWAILRFFRMLVRVITGPRKPPKDPGVQKGRGKPGALKADGVIDVDYTETSQSESNKEHQ